MHWGKHGDVCSLRLEKPYLISVSHYIIGIKEKSGAIHSIYVVVVIFMFQF